MNAPDPESRQSTAKSDGPPAPSDTSSNPEFDREAFAAAELDAADGSIKTAAVGSAVWTIAGFGTMQALRFGFNLVLTRLVAPEVFGVMAMVALIVQALHMFSDLGVRQCVIHHARGDEPVFLNTAWTLQILRGLLLWGIATAVAWPAAAFYTDMPELRRLIPIVGFAAVADGFLSTAVLTLSRRLIRGRIVLLEICTYAGSMCVVVTILALLGRSAADAGLRGWQLLIIAAGSIISSLTEMAVSYFLLRGHRHRLQWEPAAARDLLHYGGWIFLNTSTAFLASNADRLVIGKVSSDVLGVYNMAVQLARMPAMLLLALSSQLAFPLYSRLLQPGRNDRVAVRGMHLILVGGAALLATGLFRAGPSLVECIYPPQYHPAGNYIPLLAVAAWFAMLQSTAEAALLATNQLRRIVVSHVAKLVAMPPLLYSGYHFGGVPGLVVGYVIAELLRYLLLIEAVRQAGLPFWRDDLLFTLLGAAICLLDLWAGPLIWDGWPRTARLSIEVAGVLCSWAMVAGGLWLCGRLDVRRLRRSEG